MESNPLDLVGKNYLVTGAASGIGRATSILLSKCGARIILVDINKDGLEKTKHLCLNETYLLPLDLTISEGIKDKVINSVQEFGKLNGFVHLAGKSYIAPLKIISSKICEDLYKLNTYPAIELAKICSNRKIYAGEDGSFVLISSIYGLVGSAANVGYAMTKSAIQGITKALAIELASKRIRVNCVAPGFIKTNMLDSVSSSFSEDYIEKLNNLHPLGLGEANDIANAILYLLSDMSKWVTGAILNVDGGFTAQ